MEASPKHTSPGVGAGAVASRMLMVQPDAVLCKLCTRGSDDAFSVLHARYRQQVFAFVYHLLDRPGATDDAEDITQDVFSKAYTSIRGKNAEGSFKHWLFAIARNRTFDVIRARKPNSLPLDTDDETRELRAVGGSPSQAVETKQELAWLVGTVSSLPERQREALVMRELAGMSHAEIADALETSVPATKQLISRGRETVQTAASENGYRSRNAGRDLAMAAPILPFAAFALGASASTASAATTGAAAGAATSAAAGTGAAGAASAGGAAGIGGLAIGTKLVATVAAVAVVGGGAVATERVVSGGSSAPTAVVSKSGTVPGGPNANASEQAFVSVAEARERRAAAKKKAAEKRAKAKAKARKRRAKTKAKAKAKAKREAAAQRKLLKAKSGNGSGSAQSNSQSNGGGSGGQSTSGGGGGSADSDGGNSGGGGTGGNAGGGGNSGGGGGGKGGGKP